MTDDSQKIQELEKRVDALRSDHSKLASVAEKRWMLTVKEARELHTLYEQNSLNDARTNVRFEAAIKALRAALVKLGQSEKQKLDFIRLAWDQQDKAHKMNYQAQHKSVRRLSRSNATVIVIAIILYILVVKDEIAAGQVFDALISIILGGGVATYSVYESSRERE